MTSEVGVVSTCNSPPSLLCSNEFFTRLETSICASEWLQRIIKGCSSVFVSVSPAYVHRYPSGRARVHPISHPPRHPPSRYTARSLYGKATVGTCSVLRHAPAWHISRPAAPFAVPSSLHSQPAVPLFPHDGKRCLQLMRGILDELLLLLVCLVAAVAHIQCSIAQLAELPYLRRVVQWRHLLAGLNAVQPVKQPM